MYGEHQDAHHVIGSVIGGGAFVISACQLTDKYPKNENFKREGLRAGYASLM
jgi:hypothetical protein